ncbi:MFS transporter [Paenibacillus thiaminolyticus]|uniref:MFS transporter n=1 Tax=Paenibacillus thiaminolyticus TaxID=49283 RepID=UPI0011656511|nr:MFS transporter [Paenibacillus thiaminolyticus]NGP61629.1 MFS transporter [Paenibacillus thiaminolyticus]
MDIFQNRNFTLMFAGRILTNIGDSLYAVAAMWLVYDLGGSTLYTGLAGFLSLIPRLIQLLSGPIIDRLPIRSILVYTQLLQGILLLIVPLAAYGGFLSVGLVLTLTPILSACNMWVYPAQLSALPRLVAKKHLTQGNSLFSFAYQGMEVACNALSGALIALLGAISLYLWNSVGFFIGALLFAQLRIPATPSEEATATEERKLHAEPKPASHPVRKYISDMREGIRLLVATPLSRLLFGVIAINAAGGATFSLLPAFSSQIGGPGIYGILLTAQALCSLIGAICSPYVKLERLRLGFLYSIAYLSCGILWSLSVFSPWIWLTVLLYGLAWLPGGAVNVLINTVIQKGVPQRQLGVVFAAASGLSGIASPIGSLIGGSLGTLLPSAGVIASCGLAVAAVGLYWSLDAVSRSLPATDAMKEGFFAARNPSRRLERQQSALQG